MGPLARAALLTGKLCPENGVNDYWDSLPVEARTIAHAMSEQGYSTAFFGKWHLAERDRDAPFVGEAHARMIVPEQRRGGFEMWEGFESGFMINDPWLHGTRLAEPRHFKGYQADIVTERAAIWMREEQTRPTFCVVSLEPPHPPYAAFAPNGRKQDPASLTLRANVPLGGKIEFTAREELAGYYSHIESTDRAVGRFLAELDLSNTTVVFTSVHGDMHGSQGVFRKGWPFEESVRIPLLIRRPNGQIEARGDLVSLIDLPQMALSWAKGQEWVGGADHSIISMPTVVPISKQCPYRWRAIRTAGRKFVQMLDTAKSGSEILAISLYDLSNDPLELRDLSNDKEMRAEIETLMALGLPK